MVGRTTVKLRRRKTGHKNGLHRRLVLTGYFVYVLKREGCILYIITPSVLS